MLFSVSGDVGVPMSKNFYVARPVFANRLTCGNENEYHSKAPAMLVMAALI